MAQALTESIEALSSALADRRRADLAAAEAASSASCALQSALDDAQQREESVFDELRAYKAIMEHF